MPKAILRLARYVPFKPIIKYASLQTKEWGKYLNRFRQVYEVFLAKNGQGRVRDQGSLAGKQSTAGSHSVHGWLSH